MNEACDKIESGFDVCGYGAYIWFFEFEEVRIVVFTEVSSREPVDKVAILEKPQRRTFSLPLKYGGNEGDTTPWM